MVFNDSVRAVKRTKIIPAELSTISSVFVNIGIGSRASFNLSYWCIARHYNSITKKISSTIKAKLDCSKNPCGALERQNKSSIGW